MDVPMMVAGVGLLLFLAKIAEEVVLRLGLPGLLGPLTVGMLLSLTPLRSEYYFSPFLFLVGLSFTSFLLGAEELGTKLMEAGKKAIVRGLILFSVPFTITYLMLNMFMSWRLAALLAGTMAMTSTTRIYSLLRHSGLSEKAEEVLVASSVAEMAGLLVVQYATVTSVLPLIATFITMVAIIKFGEKAFSKIVELEENFSAKELPLALLISLTISISYLAEVLGANSAIAAMLLGVLASEYLMERPWIKKRYSVVTHSFFEPLFFVGTGLATKLILSPKWLIVVGLATVASGAAKVLIGILFGWEPLVAMATAVKGGVDSALLAAAWRKGIIPRDLFSTAIIMITINTFVLASNYRGSPAKGYKKVCELELDRAAVDLSEPLSVVAEMLKDRPAVVVVDALNWPIGYVTSADLLDFKKEELDKHVVFEVYHEGVPVFRCEDSVNKIIAMHEEIEESPVIAVVKEHVGYVGSLYVNKLLRLIREL